RSGNGLDVEGHQSLKQPSGTCGSIASPIGGSTNVCAGATARLRSNPEGRRTDKATIQFERSISSSASVDFCRNSMEESYVLFASCGGGGGRWGGGAAHQPGAGLGGAYQMRASPAPFRR